MLLTGSHWPVIERRPLSIDQSGNTEHLRFGLSGSANFSRLTNWETLSTHDLAYHGTSCWNSRPMRKHWAVMNWPISKRRDHTVDQSGNTEHSRFDLSGNAELKLSTNQETEHLRFDLSMNFEVTRWTNQRIATDCWVIIELEPEKLSQSPNGDL